MISLLKKKTVIGVIHLLPTIGYAGFISVEKILNKALEDLSILEKGGVDAIIIENNYDLPHKIKVNSETITLIGYIIGKIKEKTNLSMGVSILWNDFESALSLAKIYNCDFIRIPVFVDYVKTSFGEIKGEPERAIQFRKKIGAENILIFADIQVKHAEILNKRLIYESAQEAIMKHADGLIVTGKWTGNAPLIEDLRNVKRAAGEKVPIIVGSGADKNNIDSLLEFADAVIISTSLKEGENKPKSKERNIKSYDAKIDLKKVKEFLIKVRKY